MWDSPMAGVFASHGSRKSWIFFSEHRTNSSSQNTVTIGSTSEILHNTQDLNDDILLSTLDPELRPATPDTNDPKSMDVYEEHKKLAKEYLKMQTELVYLTQRRSELLQQEAEDERRQRTLRKLQEEKEEMRMLRDCLQQQREENMEQPAVARNSGDGWVIVPRNDRLNQ